MSAARRWVSVPDGGSREALAEENGYDPGEDYGQPPVMAAGEWDTLPRDHPSKVSVARHEHDTSRFGCRSCGIRCDVCDDRMCAEFGPEPAPRCAAHPTCEACADVPSCRDCADALRDHNEGTDW